jgi:hypothetical protein
MEEEQTLEERCEPHLGYLTFIKTLKSAIANKCEPGKEGRARDADVDCG